MFKFSILTTLFLLLVNFQALPNLKKTAEYFVYNNDSVFRHQIIYNARLQKVMHTKFLQQSSQWEPMSQTEWEYNDAFIAAQTFRKRAGNIWQNKYVIETVRINSRETQEVYSEFENAVPNKKSITVFAYDENGNEKLRSQKQIINNNEQLLQSFESSYDIDGQLLQTVETFYGENTLRYRTNYLYADRLLKSTTFSEEKPADSNNFEPLDETNFYYKFGTDTLSSQRTRQYSNLWGWQNKMMTQYEYDNKELTAETYYYWLQNSWIQVMRYSNSFAPNGQISIKQIQLPIHKQWRNVMNQTYNRRSEKQMSISSTFDFWGGQPNAPVSATIVFDFNEQIETVTANKLEITYGLVDVSTQAEISPANKLTVYPNPSDAIFYIDTQGSTIDHWKIKTLSGVLIKHSQAHHLQMIDLSEFASGVYLLELLIDNKTVVRKLVKQ